MAGFASYSNNISGFKPDASSLFAGSPSTPSVLNQEPSTLHKKDNQGPTFGSPGDPSGSDPAPCRSVLTQGAQSHNFHVSGGNLFPPTPPRSPPTVGDNLDMSDIGNNSCPPLSTSTPSNFGGQSQRPVSDNAGYNNTSTPAVGSEDTFNMSGLLGVLDDTPCTPTPPTTPPRATASAFSENISPRSPSELDDELSKSDGSPSIERQPNPPHGNSTPESEETTVNPGHGQSIRRTQYRIAKLTRPTSIKNSHEKFIKDRSKCGIRRRLDAGYRLRLATGEDVIESGSFVRIVTPHCDRMWEKVIDWYMNDPNPERLVNESADDIKRWTEIVCLASRELERLCEDNVPNLGWDLRRLREFHLHLVANAVNDALVELSTAMTCVALTIEKAFQDQYMIIDDVDSARFDKTFNMTQLKRRISELEKMYTVLIAASPDGTEPESLPQKVYEAVELLRAMAKALCFDSYDFLCWDGDIFSTFSRCLSNKFLDANPDLLKHVDMLATLVGSLDQKFQDVNVAEQFADMIGMYRNWESMLEDIMQHGLKSTLWFQFERLTTKIYDILSVFEFVLSNEQLLELSSNAQKLEAASAKFNQMGDVPGHMQTRFRTVVDAVNPSFGEFDDDDDDDEY